MNRDARIAGLLYLTVVATGIFCLGYVPSQLNVAGDPQATIGNILANESLFRAGIAAFMVKQLAFLCLPLVLYRVFQDIDRCAAVAMVLFAVVSVPLALVALGNRLDVLALLFEPGLAKAIPSLQLQSLAAHALESYRSDLVAARLFWGLWLLPFGYLVFKSGRLPKLLGGMLILGCAGYLVDVFGALLVPGYPASGFSSYALLPASVGEIGACLWLLLLGVRVPLPVTRIEDTP